LKAVAIQFMACQPCFLLMVSFALCPLPFAHERHGLKAVAIQFMACQPCLLLMVSFAHCSMPTAHCP